MAEFQDRTQQVLHIARLNCYYRKIGPCNELLAMVENGSTSVVCRGQLDNN